MEVLEDEKFRRIGIWGIGGARKTTLVTNLNNKLKSSLLKQPFTIVIWATVTNVLEMKKIQIQIAEILNLEAKMEDNIQRTASRLEMMTDTEAKLNNIFNEEEALEHIKSYAASVARGCCGLPLSRWEPQ
ncbi:hypothetical protein TIFTF001_032240 [Ficus carica]|uniref:NB-ARC domain-containing protein n=1 Tax=Ficus carica TaxID=3494 RepID=A0AA88DY28_FICCA|nr:hypothetical protein TIFTF001_032240 [Ficus carica]